MAKKAKKAARKAKSCACPSGQRKSTFNVTRCRTKKGRFSRAKSCSK